jgi:dolichol-phosphate mannosyltransferase
VTVITNRAVSALKRRHNWIQLGKFGIVGAVGYAVNLGVYALLLHVGLGPHWAAAFSWVVAAANNYWWNRMWTFSDAKGHFGYQGMRFFVVSGLALVANQFWLLIFIDWFGLGALVSQAIAIALTVPLNFLGNKLWSFRA